MTPEQCRERAEFHEHMAKWCQQKMAESSTTTSAGVLSVKMREYEESARYWREKAGE